MRRNDWIAINSEGERQLLTPQMVREEAVGRWMSGFKGVGQSGNSNEVRKRRHIHRETVGFWKLRFIFLEAIWLCASKFSKMCDHQDV